MKLIILLISIFFKDLIEANDSYDLNAIRATKDVFKDSFEFLKNGCFQNFNKTFLSEVKCKTCVNIYQNKGSSEINYKIAVLEQINDNLSNYYDCFYAKDVTKRAISPFGLRKLLDLVDNKTRNYFVYSVDSKFEFYDDESIEKTDFRLVNQNDDSSLSLKDFSFSHFMSNQSYNININCGSSYIYIDSKFLDDMFHNKKVTLSLNECCLFGRVKREKYCSAEKYFVEKLDWNSEKTELKDLSCLKFVYNLITNVDCACDLPRMSPDNKLLSYSSGELDENYFYHYNSTVYSKYSGELKTVNVKRQSGFTVVLDLSVDRCMTHFKSIKCQTCTTIQQAQDNTILIQQLGLNTTLDRKDLYDCFSLNSQQSFNSSFIRTVFNTQFKNLAINVEKGDFKMDMYHENLWIHFSNNSKFIFNVTRANIQKAKITAECMNGRIEVVSSGSVRKEFQINVKNCITCNNQLYKNHTCHYNTDKCNCN